MGMTRGHRVPKILKGRKKKHGYVHGDPISVSDYDPVSITPAYQLLAAGTEQASVTVSRDGNAYLTGSVRYTTTAGTSAVIAWPVGDNDPRVLTFDVSDQTAGTGAFTVVLSEPSNVVIAQGVATVEIDPLALTSQPYPINESHGVSVALSIRDVVLRRERWNHAFTESMDIASDLIGGTLAENLFPVGLAYRDPQGRNYEALDIASDLIGGVLAANFFPVNYDYRDAVNPEYEALDIASDLVGGTLAENLVPIDYFYRQAGGGDYEALDITSDLIGGTLAEP